MDEMKIKVAQQCLAGSYDNSMTFPEGLKRLSRAGFEGYRVDYRLNTRTYYLPNGETLVLTNPHDPDSVEAEFNQPGVAAAIKWAQSNAPDFNYVDFNKKVTAHGCAGYFVSILGRRVLYFGRTAEPHVEHFPEQLSKEL